MYHYAKLHFVVLFCISLYGEVLYCLRTRTFHVLRWLGEQPQTHPGDTVKALWCNLPIHIHSFSWKKCRFFPFPTEILGCCNGLVDFFGSLEAQRALGAFPFFGTSTGECSPSSAPSSARDQALPSLLELHLQELHVERWVSTDTQPLCRPIAKRISWFATNTNQGHPAADAAEHTSIWSWFLFLQ